MDRGQRLGVGSLSRGRPAPERDVGRWRWAWGLVVVFVPAVWGYNWVVMKEGLAYSGPFEFGAWRFLLGAAVLLVAMAVSHRPLRVSSVSGVAWIGILQTAANTAFGLLALAGGPAGRSAILAYAMPFWVLVMSWPLLSERPDRLQWIATGGALLGIVLIFFSNTTHWRVDAAVFAILAGLAMAGGAVLTRRLLSHEGCDPLALTTWQMLAGGVVLAIAAVVVPERPIRWTPTFLLIMAYEVLPATAMAWLFWTAMLGRLDAGVASCFLLATPLIGLVTSAVQLGERPAPLEAAGMALILAGLVVVGPMALRESRSRSFRG